MQKLIIAIAALLLSVSCATINSSAEEGDITSVRKFVNDGIDVNKKDENGVTPLMMAVKSNNPELVAYLIEKGADVNAKDKDGYTPIMYTKYMMREILINSAVKLTDVLLSIYLPKEILEELLCFDKKCSIDINAQYDLRSTYWRKRSIEKEWEKTQKQKVNLLKTFEILIEKGADINAVAKDNDTILNYALRLKHIIIVELLLKNGADADFFISNYKEKTTNKPFFICDEAYILKPYIKNNKKALCMEKFECRNIIYECIDTINEDDFVKNNSYTFLATAIKKDDTEMIDTLIKKGAYLDKEKDISKASSYIKFSDDGTITFSTIVTETPIFIAVKEKNIKSLNKLIEIGVNLNAVNDQGLTPVIIALTARRPNAKIIKTLIDNGADINFVVNNDDSEYDGMSVMEIAKKRKISIKLK